MSAGRRSSRLRFGRALRAATKGTTGTEVGRLACPSAPYTKGLVSKWLSGKSVPTFAAFASLAAAFPLGPGAELGWAYAQLEAITESGDGARAVNIVAGDMEKRLR